MFLTEERLPRANFITSLEKVLETPEKLVLICVRATKLIFQAAKLVFTFRWFKTPKFVYGIEKFIVYVFRAAKLGVPCTKSTVFFNKKEILRTAICPINNSQSTSNPNKCLDFKH